MPNGVEEGFDFERLEVFFGGIASSIEQFAAEHCFTLVKYYHNTSQWTLSGKLPCGSFCQISIREKTPGDPDSAVRFFVGWKRGKHGKLRMMQPDGSVIFRSQADGLNEDFSCDRNDAAVYEMLGQLHEGFKQDWLEYNVKYGSRRKIGQ